MFFLSIDKQKVGDPYDKVHLIKRFRMATKCGLREAKSILDEVLYVEEDAMGRRTGRVILKENVKFNSEQWMRLFKEDLRREGFIIQEIVPEELFHID